MVVQDTLLSPCILARVSFVHLKCTYEKAVSLLKLGYISFSDDESSLSCFHIPHWIFGTTHGLLGMQGPSLLRDSPDSAGQTQVTSV